jgi:transcriptional regulator with XRE-family HTH domain
VPARTQLAARRKALGYSQETLADLLDVRAQSVARWEQGTSTPLARYRRPLAECLEMSLAQLEQMINGTSDAAPGGNGHAVPAWLDHYTSLEQAAARLQTFEPIGLPGLLQTAAYARAVMQASHVSVSEDTVRERVRSRLARQAVLDREPSPLQLECVIDESVLHRVTGGREVMVEQLHHLLHLAEKPSIEIFLVPADSSILHCATFGSFRLFTSDGATDPFMTCTEDLTGFNYLDRRAAITAHADLFNHLVEAALSPSESTSLIKTIVEQYQ